MKHDTNIHIDKVRVIGPCRHKPFGKVWSLFDPETGEIELKAPVPEQHLLKEDMAEGYTYIKSKGMQPDGTATHLCFEFCPPLVFQRHNLFGHDVLGEYVYLGFNMATQKLGIKVNRDDRQAWKSGAVKITEIHLTANFACPAEHVANVIDAIDANNRDGKHRNEESSISLGWTPKRRSKYHILSIYYKWLELKTRFGPNPGTVRKRLLTEARDAIRAEVKLFSQFLDRHKHGLNVVSRWQDIDTAKLYFEVFNKYQVQYSYQCKLTVDELKMLTVNETKAYRLWLEGVDVRDQFKSRTTANKYIDRIKAKTGINIGANRRPQKLQAIDLNEIFAPTNILPVPNWLKNTKYFCQPEEPG